MRDDVTIDDKTRHGHKSAWKEAGKVFLLSRFLFFTTTCFSIIVLPRLSARYAQQLGYDARWRFSTPAVNQLVFSWLRWDAGAFLNISYLGYQHTPDVAFFPLWPLIQHLGGLLLGDIFPYSFYFVGLILANILFYFVLVLLYNLLAEDFDPALARRALFILAFSPYALFFFAGYSEPLFLVLCLSVFLLLRRGRPGDWWLAGILAYLAVLTRSSGIALGLAYLGMFYYHFLQANRRGVASWLQKLSAFAPIAFIPAALLTYMYYLYLIKGSLLIFRVQEDTIWYRQFTWPWDTLRLLIHAFSVKTSLITADILDVTAVLIALLTLALGWTRIPWNYRLFAIALAVFTLSFPTHTLEPLASQPRYMISIFPITVVYAAWSKNKYFYAIFMALTLAFLVINTIFFVGNFWVA